MLNKVNKFSLICISIIFSFMILPHLAISDEFQVYTKKVTKGNGDIYLKINGEEKPLVVHEADDFGPILSPGKDKVAFKSNRSGHYKVYVINIDGTNLRDPNIYGTRYDPIPPIYWIDNQHLEQTVFSRFKYADKGDIVIEDKWTVYSIDIDTGEKEVIDGGREERRI